MRFLDTIDISASGLTAQRLRMDTIASNIANVETTRVQNGKGPYRRQVVVFEARTPRVPGKIAGANFAGILEEKIGNMGSGVRVKEIRSVDENEQPFRKVYDPSHPDADEQGYVNYPNVNIGVINVTLFVCIRMRWVINFSEGLFIFVYRPDFFYPYPGTHISDFFFQYACKISTRYLTWYPGGTGLKNYYLPAVRAFPILNPGSFNISYITGYGIHPQTLGGKSRSTNVNSIKKSHVLTPFR